MHVALRSVLHSFSSQPRQRDTLCWEITSPVLLGPGGLERTSALLQIRNIPLRQMHI